MKIEGSIHPLITLMRDFHWFHFSIPASFLATYHSLSKTLTAANLVLAALGVVFRFGAEKKHSIQIIWNMGFENCGHRNIWFEI